MNAKLPPALAIECHSLDETRRLGILLAQKLPSTTIALQGTLGAGKTHLAKAIAVGCGIPEEDVTSPTFVICQQYFGTRPLLHADLYRLKDEDEFWELGAEEWFTLPGLVLIEWADKFPRSLPEDHLQLEILVSSPNSRKFLFFPQGDFPASILEEIERAWSSTKP